MIRSFVKSHSLATFFVLAGLFSWLLWLALLLDVQRTGNPQSSLWWLHYLGGLGPMLAAFVTASIVDGRKGCALLLRRMAGIGAPKKWIIVGAALPFLFFIAAMGIASFMGGSWEDATLLGQSAKLPQYGLIVVMLIQVWFFGYGEEVGWRGFALPRIQRKHGSIIAGLIVTIPWALWHIPTFFYNDAMMAMGVGGATGWLLSLATGSLILTWLFNGSKGSIMAVALFHGLLDVVFTSRAVAGVLDTSMGMLITLFAIGLLFFMQKQHRITTLSDV